jgi:hypothetical protein
MRTRSGSDKSGYGNSFCMSGLGFRVVCVFREFPCLKLPLFLSLGFIVAETIHGEVLLRETWIDITETARLRRATRCTTS